jgi:predicted nucleotidyltransferase
MPEALLAEIARALDAAEIPYMVIGGQAVLAYGYTRLTDDIDITLGISTERLSDMKDLMAAVGLRPLMDDQAVRDVLVLPAEHPDSRIRVDFIFSFSGYERQALDRVKLIPLDDYDVSFASVEDVIIQKTVAGRVVDLKDVGEMLLRHEDSMDELYVRTWLAAFDEALAGDFVATFDRVVADARR